MTNHEEFCNVKKYDVVLLTVIALIYKSNDANLHCNIVKFVVTCARAGEHGSQ